MPPSLLWYENIEAIARLARWLVQHEGYDVDGLLGFLDSPSAWSEEFHQMTDGPEQPEVWDLTIDGPVQAR